MKAKKDLFTISQTYQGRTYTAYYREELGEIVLFQRLATKKATLHRTDIPDLLAKALLFELVVREGRGTPDPEPEPTD